MAFRVPSKDSDEVLDYTLDWEKRLDGDSIVTSDAILEEGDLVIDSQTFSGVNHTVWVSGGTHGTECLVTMRVTTALGRTMDEVLKIAIKDKEK